MRVHCKLSRSAAPQRVNGARILARRDIGNVPGRVEDEERSLYDKGAARRKGWRIRETEEETAASDGAVVSLFHAADRSLACNRSKRALYTIILSKSAVRNFRFYRAHFEN